ncbi:MAG: thiamine pyrophosphate-binding protein [Gammaproteobacteria bacterium]|nr:MAG: thiamine pyrophosphate-binding protein [Gammaproteobacteria bacterium]
MTRMTGGQAIVRSLKQYGIDTIFALPGVQLDHFFNALYDEGNSIRAIHPRHEQGAAYMAFGYALSSGKVGAFAVVPGPGLLNTTAALATAYGCYAPVLAITGQLPAGAIGKGFGLLHELPDQQALIAGLTKWCCRIEHPSEVPDRIREAFKQLKHGVVRPVEIEMAMDTLGVANEVGLMDPVDGYESPEPDGNAIAAAAKLLGKAVNPLIVCGGGAVDAGGEILEIAQMLQAPVISHRMGRGVVSDHHYLSQTLPMGYKLWPDVDVVLVVGSRAQQQLQLWGTDKDLQVVRIDIDPGQMVRFGRPAVGIVADAGKALASLLPALAKHNNKRASREQELAELKSSTLAEMRDKLAPQARYIQALRDALPEDGIFVEELTQIGYVSRALFPVYRPRSFLSSGYQGTLGAGFPTALGAKVANPDKPVLSINGDGGFMFNVQELATAVQHGIDVVTVVFNDDAFGNVKRMQEDDYGGRVIASELRNPDFIRLAESFGVGAARAETPDALRDELNKAFSTSGANLIEVPIAKVPDPWGVSLPRAKARG